MRIDVLDDEIGSGARLRDRGVDGAQHHHAVPVAELGMHDPAVGTVKGL